MFLSLEAVASPLSTPIAIIIQWHYTSTDTTTITTTKATTNTTTTTTTTTGILLSLVQPRWFVYSIYATSSANNNTSELREKNLPSPPTK